MFTQLNQYHVVLEVTPEFPESPEDLQRHLHSTELVTPNSGRLRPLRRYVQRGCSTARFDNTSRWRSITRDSSRW